MDIEIDTVARKFLAPFEGRQIRIVAHVLERYEDDWTSNDRFELCNTDIFELAVEAFTCRWGVFLANYSPSSTPGSIRDIGDDGDSLLLECDCVPFLDVSVEGEDEIDPVSIEMRTC